MFWSLNIEIWDFKSFKCNWVKFYFDVTMIPPWFILILPIIFSMLIYQCVAIKVYFILKHYLKNDR